MSSLIIRTARQDDAAAIRRLIVGIWHGEYGWFNVTSKDYPDLYDLQSCYDGSTGHFYVASEAGQVVGTCAVKALSEHHYVLKRFFLHRSYRGTGLAQALYQKILQVLPDQGEVFLSTSSEAKAAVRFYQRQGFQAVEKKDLPDGFPLFHEDNVLMSLRL